MPFPGGFTFANFIVDAFAVFMFILWFWARRCWQCQQSEICKFSRF